MRLMTEVILAVREAVGEDYPVGVRFDGEECIKGGYGLAESQHIALRMAKLGLDYLSISAGGKFEDAVAVEGEPLYPYTGYSGDRTMPAAQYPDATNAYLAAGIRRYLHANGQHCPVMASGKIPMPELAEAILQRDEADLVGFARALLADPDWPKKLREGRSEEIVRCVYGNVCKALDERFREVRCVLWPKGALHAPNAGPAADPPEWEEDADAPCAELRPNGQVVLRWPSAVPRDRIYGYEIFRAEDGRPLAHLTSVKLLRHVDCLALAGSRYRYSIRAYDFAGRRSPHSKSVEIDIPLALDGLEAGWPASPSEATDDRR